MLRRYRALGADLPFTDLRRAHGTAMDGYFWRLTDPVGGRVIVALCGVCDDGAGGQWANVALAAHPNGFLAEADVPVAGAATDRFEVWAGDAGAVLRAGPEQVTVALACGARAQFQIHAAHDWSRPRLGGVGIAQVIPGLGQYWHPYLLGGTVSGTAVIDGEEISLDGWRAYAERNWGGGGFPSRWWWGQSQGFEDPGVCVAFAGGEVTVGPGRLEATGLVVALGERRLSFGNPVFSPVHVTADGTHWHVASRGPVWSVELLGWADPAAVHRLPVPLPTQRHSVFTAHEHLAASARLVVRRRGRIVFDGTSRLAGLEVGSLA